MEQILPDLGATLPDLRELVRVLVRLLAALAVGALIGYEREGRGKSAGLRTHMLVSMGTALFVIAVVEAGIGEDAISRVMQGLITGIGFIGAGAVLKIHESRKIRGLTTAAGIWMTAAASTAIGLGQIGTGVIAALLACVVLAILQRLEPARPPAAPGQDPPAVDA